MLAIDAPYPPTQGPVLHVSLPKFRYHGDMSEQRMPGMAGEVARPDAGRETPETPETPEVTRVVLEAGGKIALPDAIRKHLDVADGDLLVFDPQPDGTAVVLSLNRAVRQARGILRGTTGGASVVDELIAERREEARRESEESGEGER